MHKVVITKVTQRWRDRRGVYRPLGEPIRTSDYDVALFPSDTEARDFVARHHYLGTLPAARFRAGLYRRGELVGVAVFAQPASEAVLPKALPLPCERLAKVALSRFVLVDDVPSNGESWFLARTFELVLNEGIAGVVAFSDPEPRYRLDGTRVFPGHIGTIYQATNATYRGKSGPSTKYFFPDGSELTNPRMRKIRRREPGWKPAVEDLLRWGASEPSGNWLAWYKRALRTATRSVRHRGCHTYVWALDKRLRRHLPPGLDYPKWGIP